MTDDPTPRPKARRRNGSPPALVQHGDPLAPMPPALPLRGGIGRGTSRHPADVTLCISLAVAEAKLSADVKDGEKVYTYAQFHADVWVAMQQHMREIVGA